MDRPDMMVASADTIVDYVETAYGPWDTDEDARAKYARQCGAFEAIVEELVSIRDELRRELATVRRTTSR